MFLYITVFKSARTFEAKTKHTLNKTMSEDVAATTDIEKHCPLCASNVSRDATCLNKCAWPPAGAMASCKIIRDDRVRAIVYPSALLQERAPKFESKYKCANYI